MLQALTRPVDVQWLDGVTPTATGFAAMLATPSRGKCFSSDATGLGMALTTALTPHPLPMLVDVVGSVDAARAPLVAVARPPATGFFSPDASLRGFSLNAA
jgi:hypothetical protein